MTSVSNFRLRKLTEIGELESLRGSWEKLQHHPNSDLEHFLLVCRVRDEVVRPWVVSVWCGDECTAIVAGRIQTTLLRPRIGYAQLPGFPSTVLALVHEGFLGTFDDTTSEAIIAYLSDTLRRHEADLVSIHALPDHLAGVWSALAQRRGLALGVARPTWNIHRSLKLQNEPGFLVRNMRSKHRSWIKRKERDLEEAFPARCRWTWHDDVANVPEICQRIELIAKTTYQRALEAGFVDNDETRQRLALFARRRQLRVLLLEIANVPKAFWIGQVYRGSFFSSATGYTPDMQPFEVGTLAFLRMVDELVREGVEFFDFGLGDAEYKERFADQSWREATVQLFPPTNRGRAMVALLGTCQMLDGSLRAVARRFGVITRVKHYWRQTLRKRANRHERELSRSA